MWDEFYKDHYSELLGYCMRQCQNRVVAEDLVQETFLKALQNNETLDSLSSGQKRAWLFRTLKNLMCDRYRRAALESRYAEDFREDSVSMESGFGRTESELLLLRLPEQDRAMFYLRYMEDYTAAELAQMFNLPPGTVRSKLSRSRQLLKLWLEET